MTRFTYAYGLLVAAVWAILNTSGCTNTGFGPFPPSAFNPILPPGVAYFIPGLVPGPNQFQIVVFNTDPDATHVISVTSDTNDPIVRTVAPCGNGKYVADCDASSILIQAAIVAEDGTSNTITLTITPNSSCSPKNVFLAVTTTTTSTQPAGSDQTGQTGTDQTTKEYSLTETAPVSGLSCLGFGN